MARSDVAAVQEQLDAAAAELAAASVAAAKAAEAYNGARWRAAEATRAARLADRRSAAAQRALAIQRDSYRDTVVTTHSSHLEITALHALVTSDGLETLVDRSAAIDHVQGRLDQQQQDYTDAAATAQAAASEADRAAEAARSALAEAARTRDAATAAAAAAAATTGVIERRRTRLVRRLADLQGISVELAARRQAAMEEQRVTARATRTATPRGAAGATTAPVRRPESAPEPRPEPEPQPELRPDPQPQPEPEPAPDPPDDPPPADSSGGSAAVSFARAQIGEPYEWGADGPGSWDCSGLTAKAWERGGKYLPHYSVAQYDRSTPISAGQLRTGDLVFWSDNGRPSGIFHVALYSGSGRIIHAPRTGRPVTEESMYYWRIPDFYARP